MADQFDIVDIVYDAVEPVSTSFILYKDRSGDGETKNHITIRMLTLNETEVVNKGSVNINVFVKNQAKGRPDRQLHEKLSLHYEISHLLSACIGNLGSYGPNLLAKQKKASIVQI